jgi:large subunit ribosomal protein L28
MSKTCDKCGKRPTAGKQISHAHNASNRIFFPNLRTLKIKVNGTPSRIKVCMKCLKAMDK